MVARAPAWPVVRSCVSPWLRPSHPCCIDPQGQMLRRSFYTVALEASHPAVRSRSGPAIFAVASKHRRGIGEHLTRR